VALRLGAKINPTLPTQLVFGGIGSFRDTVSLPPVKTDAEGRFRISGLIAGLEYDLWRLDKGRPIPGVKQGVTATAGQEVDLGDVKK
jgi:hypothetical protein